MPTLLTVEQRKMYHFLSQRSLDGKHFTVQQLASATGYTENTVSTYIRKYLANLFRDIGAEYCIENNYFLKEIPTEKAYRERVSQTHPSLRRRY